MNQLFHQELLITGTYYRIKSDICTGQQIHPEPVKFFTMNKIREMGNFSWDFKRIPTNTYPDKYFIINRRL